MRNEDPKVEFFADNGIIEIRYFDNPKDWLYRNWKLPEPIAHELIALWIGLKRSKEIAIPLQKRTKVCELIMYAEKYVEIKSFDCCGRTTMIGWSLPVVVMEKLVVWQKTF